MHPTRLVTQATLALLLLAMVQPVHAAGRSSAGGNPGVGGNPSAVAAIVLTPPAAALHADGMPSSGIHALGFVANANVTHPVAPQIANPASLPAAVDLSQYNPPVGDQGQVGSCTSWATGYYLRGWYARRDGYYPAGGPGGTGSYAPMYLYSQITHGQNVGTSFKDNLSVLQGQGIDTRADYTQGDYDYQDPPTEGETFNAARIRLASYSDVGGPNLRNWIETTMAGGNPVALGIPVYPEFDHATAANPLVGTPLPNERSRGGHAVFASKYDANGVWIENSWGTSFGLNGWVELSWSFVNQYANEAVSEVPLSPLGIVPGVLGQAPNTAASAVHAAGFAVTFAPVADPTCNHLGRIERELPNPGSWAEYGSTVTLFIGSRPRTPCP